MSHDRKRLASEAARLLASLGARKGGKASAAALSPEERHQRARMAVQARWSSRPANELPVDQKAVMTRLAGNAQVALRIAPGSGGARRRAAIAALERAGKVRVISSGAAEVVIAPAEPSAAKKGSARAD